MTSLNKQAIRRLAKQSGGIQSRYGEEFGFHMSTIALQRFADTIKAPLLEWIRQEGDANDTCTKDITGEVCSGCKCKHKEKQHGI